MRVQAHGATHCEPLEGNHGNLGICLVPSWLHSTSRHVEISEVPTRTIVHTPKAVIRTKKRSYLSSTKSLRAGKGPFEGFVGSFHGVDLGFASLHRSSQVSRRSYVVRRSFGRSLSRLFTAGNGSTSNGDKDCDRDLKPYHH